MNKAILIAVFLIVAPVNLITCLFALSQTAPTSLQPSPQRIFNSQLFAALPESSGEVLGTFSSSDARPVIIKNYLEHYYSPMSPYANLIVSVSDKYGIDWRLLVAIAQQESNLGKKIPENSYNAWGWGIHSEGTLHFSSWQEGIETVAKGIKEDYINKGYITPEEIMSKYTPSSNGSWAYGVNQFLNELEAGEPTR